MYTYIYHHHHHHQKNTTQCKLPKRKSDLCASVGRENTTGASCNG